MYSSLSSMQDMIYDAECFVIEAERNVLKPKEIILALDICDELTNLSKRLNNVVRKSIYTSQSIQHKQLDKLSRCLDKIEDKQSERALLAATRALDEIKTETGYYACKKEQK